MNREIKFRAWTGENIVFVHTLDIYPDSQNCRVNTVVASHYDKWPLMQFTGLVDSETKQPIYEDDIILYDNRLGIIKWTGHGFNGVYTNGDGSWYDEWEDGISDYGKIYKRGNIYENPELLK